jgi:hypothetical protein
MHNLLLLSDTMTHQVKGSYLKLLIGKERHQYQKLIRTKLISKDIFEIDEQQWYSTTSTKT